VTPVPRAATDDASLAEVAAQDERRCVPVSETLLQQCRGCKAVYCRPEVLASCPDCGGPVRMIALLPDVQEPVKSLEKKLRTLGVL